MSVLALAALASACLRGQTAASANAQSQITVTIPPAPVTPPALDLPLKITRRPATFGVPLKESANVRDATKLALKDATGRTVAAQFRVLSRWRGTAADAGRPIKWLLVDADTAAGDYRLTTGENPKPAAGIVTSGGAVVQVSAARVRLRLPKQGATLVAGFELDGSERLKRPATISLELPRAALIVSKVFAARKEVLVSDSAALQPGARIRFENTSEVSYDTEAGVMRLAVKAHETMQTGRAYRLDEGTSRQEDIFVERMDESGWFLTRAPLRFPHPAGAFVRDLVAENETAVISAVKGQTVTLAAPLKNVHSVSERIIVADENAAPLRLTAWVNETRIEENGPLRTVIRQDGNFQPEGAANAAGAGLTPLRFTVRYHIYAAQPFVRVQFRIVNTGVFGFGAYRAPELPPSQHVLLNGLSLDLPFNAAAGARPLREEARTGPGRQNDKHLATVSLSTVAANNPNVEVTVPEFAENFPKALTADGSGIRFDLLPPLAPRKNDLQSVSRNSGAPELPPLPLSRDYYIFDGARAKSTELFIGAETRAAAAMTGSFSAAFDPVLVAQSQAVRTVMVERRDWRQVFGTDRQLAASAVKLERWLASAYAREANEEQQFGSIYEVRQSGEHFGWRNFGDLQWGDGYANLHYDLPWIMLREFLRTGDRRAFQLGSEMARYRADWGQYQADEYLDKGRSWSLRGMAFYEKGDHGTYREPIFTHHWIEGLWLYWALTGDEAVHQSAIEGAEAIERFNFTFDNSLSWGESRFVGWPVLAMMAAWRYGGEARYLEKAKRLAYMLIQAEEDGGRKGYYIPPGSNIGNCTQPFMWAGYAQLGMIEYWRETGDKRAADFMVRVADWLVGKMPGQRPALIGGISKPDGSYLPLGVPYFWCPNKENEAPTVANGMMTLPLLSVTAQLTGRADLRAKAQQLFRDATWFRDAGEQGTGAGEQSPIAFRSRMYGGSYPKVYGQFSLFVPEYLAVRATDAAK
ncbi:MAG TPA: hypothetical protein VNQ79_20980 [Blastocatellia bacterium]|nr:hypothetical protein [Blastocatellia bacterium]